MLIKSKLQINPNNVSVPPGWFNCNKSPCSVCKIMEPSSYVTISPTNKKYPVQVNINCDSRSVINKFQCKEFLKFYRLEKQNLIQD